MKRDELVDELLAEANRQANETADLLNRAAEIIAERVSTFPPNSQPSPKESEMAEKMTLEQVRNERDELRRQLSELRESTHYANGVADLAMKHRDAAESRLAAADALLRKCRAEFAGLPHSLGYDFTHLPEIDAHLAQPAQSVDVKSIREVINYLQDEGNACIATGDGLDAQWGSRILSMSRKLARAISNKKE